MLTRASLSRNSRTGERVLGAPRHRGAAGLLPGPAVDGSMFDALEHVLAQDLRLAERDRVLAGEAGRAQPVGRLLGRGDQALLGDVAEESALMDARTPSTSRPLATSSARLAK